MLDKTNVQCTLQKVDGNTTTTVVVYIPKKLAHVGNKVILHIGDSSEQYEVVEVWQMEHIFTFAQTEECDT